VFFPGVAHCVVNKKKTLFPSSFWGIFDFFVFFNNFGKLEKELKNAMLQRRIECRRHTSSKCREHIDAQSKGKYAGKGHSGKILHGSTCQDAKAKCYKVFV
jgi:hypothetical protein